MTVEVREAAQQEDRIRVAIENWAPRFVANGVDINDFNRITSGLTRWSDWCAAWSAAGEEHAALGEEAEEGGFYQSAGLHFFQASMLYHFGKFMFFQDATQYSLAHDRAVNLYRRALPYLEFPGEPVRIPYENASVIQGILRKPWHIPKPPVVIISPGLDSVKEEMHCYGEDFLRRGMAVLAIDGPGQGELEFELPLRYDPEVVTRYVIDHVESRSDLNADRIGMLGISLGGYNAIRSGAFEPRLRAAVALATGYRLAAYFDQLPILTRDAFVHKLKAPDSSSAQRMLGRWDLEGVVEKVRCPLLVIMGRHDRLFPAEDTEQMAHDIGPKAELLMYEDGNHVCNNIPYKYRPRQADWMSKMLSARN